MPAFQERTHTQSDPFIQYLGMGKIFLPYLPGYGMQCYYLCPPVYGAPGFIHGNMSIHAHAQDSHIYSLPFADKLLRCGTFSRKIRGTAVEEVNVIFGNTEWPEQVFVDGIPAAALVCSIKSYPLV